MTKELKLKIKVVGLRFLKALLAVVIAGLAQKYGDNPLYLLIAPLLLGGDKLLRWK